MFYTSKENVMEVERISIKAFNNTVNEFRNAITKYEQAREKFFSSTDKLFVNWVGEGKDKFEKYYIQLKTQLKDEEDSLRAIADNLETVGLSYTEMDKSAAAQLSS